MKSIFKIYWIILLFSYASPVMSAEKTVEINSLLVCPDQEGFKRATIFKQPFCKTLSIRDIALSGQTMWARASFSIEPQTNPLGLFVTGSAASAVYINGTLIGHNGIPGKNKKEERPGKMDGVIYIPPTILQPEDNNVTLHLSSHHRLVDLYRPLHSLVIKTYANPTNIKLRQYWWSLLTFGAFLLGALYFGMMARKSKDKTGPIILCLMSYFALAQLLAEVSRGLVSYSYPIHEVRLFLITLFALGTGLCLIAYIFSRFVIKYWARYFFVAAFGIILIITFVPGFDAKTIAAILIPTLMSIGITGYFSLINKPLPKKKDATSYLIALTLFAFLIGAAPELFLNIFFFFVVAGLLAFLFIKQAQIFAEEQRERLSEVARAKQLEYALRKTQRQGVSSKVPVNTRGKVHFVSVETLTHCKGAGDYVELYFETNKDEMLHSGTLGRLENELPPTFLRVHRSYIVNTAFVMSLEREASGNGRLKLQTGVFVPVSRRIMPKVRDILE